MVLAFRRSAQRGEFYRIPPRTCPQPCPKRLQCSSLARQPGSFQTGLNPSPDPAEGDFSSRSWIVDTPQDAKLCQHLLRKRAVGLTELDACARIQREARALGQPVPGLRELLLGRGLLDEESLDALWQEALGHRSLRRTPSGRFRVGPVRAGDRLGRYRLLEEVARGAMGTVYRARDEGLKREVALKVHSPRSGSDEPQLAARFEREARLACSLEHPHLGRGIEFGEAGGQSYYVMEYYAWPTLAELLHSGPVSPAEVVRIASGVASALAYLHGQGVVHRDVKPENILVGPDDVKLIDLGLAREVGAVSSSATATSVTLGTPRYISPEQARGEREIGPAADLYSFGVSLYHALAGEPPFPEANGIVAISRHLFDAVPDVRSVNASAPPLLADLIASLTQKAPEDRLACASLVVDALEPLTLPVLRAA
ncbi:MAG: serine/threonine-protein kinase [Planctomycetota bacterium]